MQQVLKANFNLQSHSVFTREKNCSISLHASGFLQFSREDAVTSSLKKKKINKKKRITQTRPIHFQFSKVTSAQFFNLSLVIVVLSAVRNTPFRHASREFSEIGKTRVEKARKTDRFLRGRSSLFTLCSPRVQYVCRILAPLAAGN